MKVGKITNEKTMSSDFWDKLVDWNEFECFVQKMYEEDPNLVVQHNVTLVGKSGAKRQIDVLVTQKTKLMTLTTIVECKRWKEKVNRAIIDIVSAALDDLNANKGVVFTTSGYEEGAIEYAKYKNIDIFLVRDLLDEEWGKPGRHIQFWIQLIGSKVETLRMPNASFYPAYPGAIPEISLEICANKEDESFFLYNRHGTKGGYLGKIIMRIQEKIHGIIGEKVPLLSEEDAKKEILYKSNVSVDFGNYEYNLMHLSNGIIKINQIVFELITHISQTEFNIDRGENLDFAFVVENYIVNQKHRVLKRKNEDNIWVSDNLEEIKCENVNDEDILKNGSLMKVYLGAEVIFNITGDEIVRQTSEIKVKME